MSTPLFYKYSITIKADADKVWDALTNPEMTKQYMFGCKAITDWKVGSEVIWKGATDGIIYVKGHVVKFEPNSVLAFTVFDPNGTYEDIPENYLTGEYRLSYSDSETTLDISQGDYSVVADGEQRYKDADKGWKMAMGGLKKLVEG